MARYQSATPLEQERIRQQLMAQRHQQMMQQQGFVPGLSPSLPGSPSMGGFDSQVGMQESSGLPVAEHCIRSDALAIWLLSVPGFIALSLQGLHKLKTRVKTHSLTACCQGPYANCACRLLCVSRWLCNSGRRPCAF